MARPVTVLIVDDHPLIRRGFVNLLAGEPGYRVVGEAADGRTGLEMAEKLTPDVVLMDFNMPGLNGADTTRLLLARQEAAVVAVSSDDQLPVREAMHAAGAVAFFRKNDDMSVLMAMLREVVWHG
jgi:DNA-binding NarL/FixJ family response regulator